MFFIFAFVNTNTSHYETTQIVNQPFQKRAYNHSFHYRCRERITRNRRHGFLFIHFLRDAPLLGSGICYRPPEL